MSKYKPWPVRGRLHPWQEASILDMQRYFGDKPVIIAMPKNAGERPVMYGQISGRGMRARTKWYQRLYDWAKRRKPVVILDHVGNIGIARIAINQCAGHEYCLVRESITTRDWKWPRPAGLFDWAV